MLLKERDIQIIQSCSGVIEDAARSLHNAVRYIYAVGADGFYNIGVKDLFKVCLIDITDSALPSNLGIPVNSVKFAGFETAEFKTLNKLFFYAFAVRLPFLRRVQNAPFTFKDSLLLGIFRECVLKGAENIGGIIAGDFKSMMKTAKSRASEPPFNGDWFRRWVYTVGGELAVITNTNMFLLGCMDALLPLYYAKLTDTLTTLTEVSGI